MARRQWVGRVRQSNRRFPGVSRISFRPVQELRSAPGSAGRGAAATAPRHRPTRPGGR
jgi:hypothetical protein